ncbi:MAG: hypothetical protein Q9182_005893 [Xanthomendoza sp. 2 TL-2023]
MSAILSADDLNDFISPGVACIKPVETLPLQKPEATQNPYEVTTEDKLLAQDHHAPAQISLTDCLACSGCVTSAEAVLVSLQSHSEVLNTLDSHPSLPVSHHTGRQEQDQDQENGPGGGKLFVASVSPQVRASIAATYGVSEVKAGWMINQLLGGPSGLASGGTYGSAFTWIVDTNAMREACLVLSADEVVKSLSSSPLDTAQTSPSAPKKPVLTSACPGWICYAEKTHPHVLPHLSGLKSPQALTGTLIKTFLSQRLNIHPDQIWHLAVMPCFDKKLEASREELTDVYWRRCSPQEATPPVRDVDCVITAREILMLADTRGISFPALPQEPISTPLFPDPILDAFLFPYRHHPRKRRRKNQEPAAGSSGGYLHHVLQTQLASSPGSKLHTMRGRNADVVEYSITRPQSHRKGARHIADNDHDQDKPEAEKQGEEAGEGEEEEEETIFRAARYYGFRNIQNLVRKLKPPRPRRLPGSRLPPPAPPPRNQTTQPTKIGHAAPAVPGSGGISDYAYIEVMACPGGCTNGGGQIKVDDLGIGQRQARHGMSQKEWLGVVDEAYFSMSDGSSPSPPNNDDDETMMMADDDRLEDCETDGDVVVNGINVSHVRELLMHWSRSTGIEVEKLCFTTYREVQSDVGKKGGEHGVGVEKLAGKIDGGW